MAVASFAQGFLGFGFGILAMSALASQGLLHAAGVVNLTGVLTTAGLAAALWRHIDWKLAAPILPAAAAGVAAGVLALGTWHEAGMTRALGAVVVAIALYNLAGRAPARPLPRLWGVPVGALSGALAGAFNIGGPPVIAYLYSRPATPSQMKATTQLVFFSMAVLRVPMALSQGMFSPQIVRDAAIGAPVLALGLLGGIAAGHRLSPARFRTISWIFFGILGLKLALFG